MCELITYIKIWGFLELTNGRGKEESEPPEERSVVLAEKIQL